MQMILRSGIYILLFNAVLFLIALVWYLTIGRHQKDANEFEDYMGYLFSHVKIRDPWILSGDKWVNTSQNPSPSI